MNLWEMILTALQDQGALVLRLAVACLCGGAIGIERTLRQKDAGFRTHVIVALGAALMMVISKYGFVDVVGNGITSDAGRIASNIVTGISFLCAGMIVKGATIKGLTTAAGIWVTSAVGMAIGCGMYLTGVLATILVIVVQIVFHTFLIGYDKVLANDNTAELLVRIKNSPEAVAHLREQLAERRIEIVSTKINADADIYLNLAMNVRMHDPAGLEKVVAILQENEDIQAISL
ncbi:MAG: MgtC/SapB family protein [Clostridia bacterium]|nr:MgtC/SapB family protein [Clostridia bacterium]